jgi:UDP-glucose 4-epimerase
VSKKGNVLVTGGAGFIGSHFVDKLIFEGYGVSVLDNLSVGKLENIASHLKSGKVKFVQGDIRDAAVVTDCLEGVDIVVHFAAQTSVTFSVNNPDLTFDVNAFGTQNLLKACVKKNVERFVFASTCAVYGDPECLPVDESCRTNPISPYAESKLMGERYCLEFHEQKLLGAVVLRFFNVYGSRQGLNDYSGVITRFIDRAKRNEPLIIYGDGLQTRDFVNVADIVDAVFASMNSLGAAGEIVQIGSGKATSINELAKSILELVGLDSGISYLPPRAGDIRDSYADISKAKRVLGYKPKVTLRDGLKALL